MQIMKRLDVVGKFPRDDGSNCNALVGAENTDWSIALFHYLQSDLRQLTARPTVKASPVNLKMPRDANSFPKLS